MPSGRVNADGDGLVLVEELKHAGLAVLSSHSRNSQEELQEKRIKEKEEEEGKGNGEGNREERKENLRPSSDFGADICGIEFARPVFSSVGVICLVFQTPGLDYIHVCISRPATLRA